MKISRGLIIVVAALLFSLGAWLSWQTWRSVDEGPLEIAGIYLSTPKPIAPFILQSADDQAFTQAQLLDHWTFMFFGYTSCPDACPLTLSQLNLVDKKLSEQPLKQTIHYVLVSVDPRRDTPAKLAQYTAHFNPKFQGVTGQPEELDKLAKPLGIYYAVPDTPADSENYLVDHSSVVVLINPAGQLQAVFSAPHNPAQIAADFLAIQQRWPSE